MTYEKNDNNASGMLQDKKGDKYLAYYHHNKETAQHEVDKLNKYKPQKMWNGGQD